MEIFLGMLYYKKNKKGKRELEKKMRKTPETRNVIVIIYH